MTSRRLLLVAALVDLLAPVAAVVVVLFTPAAIDGHCNATVGDGTPRPPCPVQVIVWPPIRTNEAVAISLAIFVMAWLLSNWVVLAHLVKFDRPQLRRVAMAIVFVAAAAAGVGFLNGLTQRLRYAVEGGIGWGLGGLVLAWVVAVAWVGLRPANGGRYRPA